MRTLLALSSGLVPTLVYLTGFMGSGKSTVGPLVADALGYRFVDLDWLVEARAGRSVTEIFADGGEPAFRAAEAEALAETTHGAGLVVATGGGTLLDPRHRATAAAAGAVVWLRVAPDVVVSRLGVPHGRPLLAGTDGRPLAGDALASRVAALLVARTPHYAAAGRPVDADALPDVVARRIVEALRG